MPASMLTSKQSIFDGLGIVKSAVKYSVKSPLCDRQDLSKITHQPVDFWVEFLFETVGLQ